MALWLVLGGLLILLVWAIKLVFDLGTALPVLATLGVLFGLAAIWGVKRLLVLRAAKKLERAVRAQAAAQTDSASPERRAEIEALQSQLRAGVAAIKSSREGSGGKRGAAALYHLPWYVVIGPPGAGKTMALRQSGLEYSSGGTSGALRGVGGTRNCDWWLTNEAILLDTAGRYTTQSDDAAEWHTFLSFLLEVRRSRPIDGIIIALGISELLDADAVQLEAVGKKLRARIDEVITQLHMVVPVYVVFTKLDLIAGFSEFFSDLKKSERAEPWGATLKIAAGTTGPAMDPAKSFEREFDLLVKHLHARTLRRCVGERSREAREQLYQFPLEFAELKSSLSSLLSTTFAPNTFQGTPLFRGFYFTSGTQEGRPIDRVLARMSSAMGIAGRSADARGGQHAAIESKSYFLSDLFLKVIFRDRSIAVRSAVELRRQRLLKLAIAGVTLALAALLCLPALASYEKNRAFLDDAERHSKLSASFAWDDQTQLSKKFPLLDPSLEQLREHDRMDVEGVPWGMGWWMFKADKVHRPTLTLYVTQLQLGFVSPCKQALSESLRTSDPTQYVQVRSRLKQYLMLRDVEHLDVEWAAGRYTHLWVEQMKGRSDVTDAELRELMRPHVRYYFELLKRGKVKPVELDDELVERVRMALQSVPVQERYYEMLVNSLKDERIDDAGEPTIANMLFPPIQLPMIFADRSDVTKYFQSRSAKEGRGYQQVEGPYTERGHYGVVKQLEGAQELLRTEAWVVAPTADEAPGKIPEHVIAVKTRYEELYIQQWLQFFADIQIKTPQTPDEAIELFTAIATIEYPHRRLIELLDDHTQWRSTNPLANNDAVMREANRRFNQKLNMYTHGIVINVNLRDQLNRMERVPAAFAGAKGNGVIHFARPPKSVGMKAGSGGDTKVFLYTQIVTKLREKIESAQAAAQKRGDGSFSPLELNEDFDKARKEAEALLLDYDSTATSMLKPLLLAPLSFGDKAAAQ